jgi:hypothetical protein
MITQLMNSIHSERGYHIRDTLTCIDYLMSKGPGEDQYRDIWTMDVIDLANTLRQDLILKLPGNLFNPDELRMNLLKADMRTIDRFNAARIKAYNNVLSKDMLTYLQ